jgi:hypothetical protein
MSQVPQGKDMKATYENIIVCCPSCGRENIFNRASDLKGVLHPIDYLEVSCLFADCARPFYLSGDLINSAYEMLIYDCYELLERKHYSYCILNLAQAFEAFFSQYLRVVLLYRAFASDSKKCEGDIEKLNDLMKLLHGKIEKLSFDRLRYLFFCQALHPPHPSSLRQAEDVINTLPFKSNPVLPSDDSIRNATIFSNKRVPDLLVRLRSCNVSKLRNQVVHKSAYRPTLDEVNDALKETREILFPLGQLLDIRSDDLNWYMRRRHEQA